MKKILIISLGILSVVLIIVWGYLLINGAPKSISEFTKNIFGTATDIGSTPLVPTQPTQPAISTDTGSQRRILNIQGELVKLSEKPVAGFTILAHASSAPTIRYMLKGTGNIYDISLETGEETRISSQTIPQVVRAVWSPTGTHALITTDVLGSRGDTFLGTLSPKDDAYTLDLEEMPFLENPAFTLNGAQLLYTVVNRERGTTGFSRTLATGNTRELFTAPFRESALLWDIWTTRDHFIYTKPATDFTGYGYFITPKGLKRLAVGKELSAARMSHNILTITVTNEGTPSSFVWDIAAEKGESLSIIALSEKCAGIDDRFWCGMSDTFFNEPFPVSWYQGTVTYADALWKTTGTRSEKIANPETLVREQIDVTDMHTNGTVLVFKNKKDDNLWLYTIPQ